MRYGQYDVPTVDQEVNFKVGQPCPDLLPLAQIREAAAAKFAEDEPLFLQYGDIPGYQSFRECLAKFLTEEYGAPVPTSDVFAINGITGGLSLICSVMLRSGDLVFAEDPSYFLALRIFNDYKLNCVQIPMESDGIDLVALERELQVHVPKMLYIIPTAQNPTGRTLSEAKRKALVALAYKYDFLIVADEVYHLLTFPGIKGPLPMPFYDPNKKKVISLGSFSKILAPALRCGWMQATPELLKPIYDCGMLDSSGGINPVVYGIVHKAIETGMQKKNLTFVKEELHGRAQHLMECCDKYLTPLGVTHETPLGGYFVLVKLPNGMNANELLDVCVKNKVRYLPGSTFGKGYGSYLRLSFSYYSAADIDIGIQRLAASVKMVLAQHSANGTSPINN